MHMGLGVSDVVFAEYSCKDSAVLLDCRPSLNTDIAKLDNKHTLEYTLQLVEPCVFMSQHGIKVDERGRDELATQKEKEKETLVAKIQEMVGYDINPDSPPQVADYFYNCKGLKPYLKRGKPTTDETALTRLANRGYAEADTILDIRGLTAAIPKYYRSKLVDGRLKCFYNPIGAADTGRLSSSKTIFGEGMNMQNQPHEVRRFLLADDGYICGDIDLSQAENRCVAYFSPEPEMIKAFENNIDIHRQTACPTFKKSIEEISDVKGSTNIGRGKYSERDIGKHSNHSFNYYLSAQGFSLRFGVALDESHYIRTTYLNTYPGIERYWKFVQSELQSCRKLRNPFGRTRLFLDRMGEDLFKEGYAYLPQSTVASIISWFGLIPFYYNEEYKDLVLLNQVHDSIGFQLPLSIGWEKISAILLSMKRQLEQPVYWRGAQFTIPAELKMGFNFGRADEINPQGLRDVDLNKTQDGIAAELASKFDGR
jgi:DNA polymerase I-like protein with 3'-5' exonuclease and polymerase domains